MKAKTFILTGGVLNTIMTLFHIFLCFHISKLYGADPVYPLLQMFSVSGTIMIFFFAYTSLFYSKELTASITGKSIILFNIAIYGVRALGEFLLFPAVSWMIVGLCGLMVVIYSLALIEGKREKPAV